MSWQSLLKLGTQVCFIFWHMCFVKLTRHSFKSFSSIDRRKGLFTTINICCLVSAHWIIDCQLSLNIFFGLDEAKLGLLEPEVSTRFESFCSDESDSKTRLDSFELEGSDIRLDSKLADAIEYFLYWLYISWVYVQYIRFSSISITDFFPHIITLKLKPTSCPIYCILVTHCRFYLLCISQLFTTHLSIFHK